MQKLSQKCYIFTIFAYILYILPSVLYKTIQDLRAEAVLFRGSMADGHRPLVAISSFTCSITECWASFQMTASARATFSS